MLEPTGMDMMAMPSGIDLPGACCAAEPRSRLATSILDELQLAMPSLLEKDEEGRRGAGWTFVAMVE